MNIDHPVFPTQNQDEAPASGYDPRTWEPGDIVDIDFPMEIKLHPASPRVHVCSGKVVLTRGPLVYCLESLVNPDLDIFTTQLDPTALRFQFSSSLLGGAGSISAKYTS